jgi:carboxylesterase type B
VNRDEGTSSANAPSEPLLQRGFNMSGAELRAFLDSWLPNQTAVARASQLYAVGSSPLYSSPYWAAVHFLGDVLFTCPALHAARQFDALTAPGAAPTDRGAAAPVFLYWFDHPPRDPPFDADVPGFNGSAGVSHAFEMQFVWQGLPQSLWAPYGALVGAEEYLLSRTIAAYWTNFVRSADPNVGTRTSMTRDWPRVGSNDSVSAGGISALELRLPTPSVVSGRAEAQCAFIDQYSPLRYP